MPPTVGVRTVARGTRCGRAVRRRQACDDPEGRQREQQGQAAELQPQRRGTHARRGGEQAMKAGERNAAADPGVNPAARAAGALLRECAQAPHAGRDEDPGGRGTRQEAQRQPDRGQRPGHRGGQRRGREQRQHGQCASAQRHARGGERTHQVPRVIGGGHPAALRDVQQAFAQHQGQHRGEGEPTDAHGGGERERSGQGEQRGGNGPLLGCHGDPLHRQSKARTNE